ncbi:MAG: amidohydrolase family protein, partial [Gammaproteobacteria bacterium]|nr:amidohydrolase family protein [Gammaproteobacteria bacterium]
MKKSRVILILAITSMFGVLAQTAEADRVRAIVGATVVDLGGGEPIRNAVVLIQGEEITAVGHATAVEIPATAEVIDAKGTWLIPGMMNMHVHLGLILPG